MLSTFLLPRKVQEVKPRQIAYNGTISVHILPCFLPVGALAVRDERATLMTHSHRHARSGASAVNRGISAESDARATVTGTIVPRRERDSPRGLVQPPASRRRRAGLQSTSALEFALCPAELLIESPPDSLALFKHSSSVSPSHMAPSHQSLCLPARLLR